MRKQMLVLAALVLSVTVGSITASAQTQISLDGTASGGATFTTISPGVVVMDVGAGVTGTATGTGAFAGLGNNLTWSLTGGPTLLGLIGTIPGISAEYFTAAGTFNFDIVNSLTLVDELNGTLNLFDLNQTVNSATTDNFLVANLTGITGALAGSFGGGTGTAQLTLDLTGVGFLPALVGTSAAAPITHGLVTPTAPTPEPGSLLLLGSGLLSLGGLIRRRVVR